MKNPPTGGGKTVFFSLKKTGLNRKNGFTPDINLTSRSNIKTRAWTFTHLKLGNQNSNPHRAGMKKHRISVRYWYELIQKWMSNRSTP